MRTTACVLFVGWAAALTTAWGGTWHVAPCGNDAWSGASPTCVAPDGPKLTIAAAIAAAAVGDEIIVADGVYTGPGNRALSYGKDVTLRSANGPAACIIDCQSVSRAFSFNAGETNAAVLRGFTIRNGRDSWAGGAIYCGPNGHPTIENCTIVGCTAYYAGAMKTDSSNVRVTGCTFVGNGDNPGGNRAGGAEFTGGSPVVTNCVLRGNYGVGLKGSAGLFERCTIEGNLGTGVYLGGPMTLSACRVLRNRGVGVYVWGGEASTDLFNCIIGDNGEEYGASRGLEVRNYGAIRLTHCVLFGNYGSSAGAIYTDSGAVTLHGSIVAGNRSNSGVPIRLNNTFVVSNSFIEGGPASVAGGAITWGPGNIFGDDPGLTLDGHLRADSVCRDAGGLTPLAPTDIDGEGRPVGTAVDIGADEFLDSDDDGLPNFWEAQYFGDPSGGQPTYDDDGDGLLNLDEYRASRNPLRAPLSIYVAPEGNDSWDGLAPTWNGASGPKATIQAAIDSADRVERDQVQLADGVYAGPGNRDIRFRGKLVEVRSINGPDQCIIDCGDTFHGVTFDAGVGSTPVLSGISIVNFDSNHWGVRAATGSAPLIENCRISSKEGSAVWMDGSGGTVRGCEIASAEIGIVLQNTDARVERCQLERLLTAVQGMSGRWVVDACRFERNRSVAVAFYGALEGRVVNSVIRNGDGASPARIVFAADGFGQLVNCVITGNHSRWGPIIDSPPGGALLLTNCVVWGNSTPSVASSGVVARSCIIEGGFPGPGNSGAAPDFAFPRDYHVLPSSPCIDSGIATPAWIMPSTDFAGDPRQRDGDGDGNALPDRGIYEFDPAATVIGLSDDRIEWRMQAGTAPQSLPLELRAIGANSISWQIASAAPWFSASPASGTSSGEVAGSQLTANIAGLSPGRYTATATVVDTSGHAPPRTIELVLWYTTTRRVPSTYPSLRAGIMAAQPGDVVLVAPGTYSGPDNTDLTIDGEIEVRSAAGPATCIIDGEYEYPGFTLSNSAMLDGFTIRGCGGPYDTAVNLGVLHPVLRNCIIENNPGTALGASYSDAEVIDCTIRYATNSETAVQVEYSEALFKRCTITANTTAGTNAIVRVLESFGLFVDSTIAGNTNTGANFGGGISVESGDLVAVNCSFLGNKTAYHGAALWLSDADALLSNCVVAGNAITDANGRGGAGIYCNQGSTLLASNCTFAANTSTRSGGGVYASGQSVVTLDNCVLSGDTAPTGPEAYLESSATLSVTNSTVTGGQAKITVTPGATLNWGAGNLTGDPRFFDPDGPDNNAATWADNNFRLRTNSPCIDAGNTTLLPADELDVDDDGDFNEPLPLDRDRRIRVRGAAVDQGAYEVNPADLNADGAISGADLAAFVRCLQGPGVTTPPPGVSLADFQQCDLARDADVDLADFALMQAATGL